MDNAPLTATTYQITTSPAGLRFTVKPTKTERPLDTGEILLAIYDKPNGRLLSLKIVPCDGSASYIIDTQSYSNVTAKVFVWNNAIQIEPLGMNEIIDIQ